MLEKNINNINKTDQDLLQANLLIKLEKNKKNALQKHTNEQDLLATGFKTCCKQVPLAQAIGWETVFRQNIFSYVCGIKWP